MIRRAIFLSYRRNDNQYAAGRLYEHIVTAFGAAAIFKDIDTISPGDDFSAHLMNALSQCDIMLVLIGPAWLDVRDARGARRLDDPGDWVRMEVETALHRGLHVVPVLLGAPMPEVHQLPEGLRALAGRQALAVRSDPDFQGDVERLIANLRAQGLPPALDEIDSVWAKIRQTRQLDALDHFIETFNGTVQAFDARRRQAQLAEFLDLHRDAGLFEFPGNWDSFLECDRSEFENQFGKTLPDYLCHCADRIDAFLDRWHPSDLADEVLWLRRGVCEAAASLPDMMVLVDDPHRDGRRDWSEEMPPKPKLKCRVYARLRPSGKDRGA